MSRCPVCGEELSWSDKKHVRERPPKYFHEIRRWQLAFSLSLILETVLVMLNALYPRGPVRLLTLIGALIALPSAFFSSLKWWSTAKEYKVPWKKTLSLTGTNR